MASNRYRSTRSLGNKINSISNKVGEGQKTAANPHLNPEVVVSEYLATDSVKTDAIATRATTELQMERGSVGTEHLGIINQIVTDTGVVFKGTPGNIVVSIQGSEGQTGDLLQFTNFQGDILASVGADGEIFGSTLHVDEVTTTTLNAELFGGDFMQITQLDDISTMFDGLRNRFPITYQGVPYEVLNPFRLLIYIDGIIQQIYTEEYVWQSPYPKKLDVFVDSDGWLAFSNPPQAGSTFSGRIMSGQETTTQSTNYPYRPTDLLLGA